MVVFSIVVAIICSGSSVTTAATTRQHQQYAFVTRRSTLQQQWQHHSSQQVRRRTTKLSANGGMDAYDAQMAAIMSSSTRQSAMITTTTDDQNNNNFSNEDQYYYASENSKWSGQNSYTQQLLQQPPPPPPATVGVDAYAADMDIESRSSFVQEQQEKEQSTEASVVDVDYDPYEMQFANYLQNLHDEMDIQVNEEEENEEASSVVVSSSSVSNGVEYIQVNEEEFTTAVSSNSNTEQQQLQSLQSNKSQVSSSPTTKSQEDLFLQMVSNEVQYKKLLNQSPYALTDIEWSTIIQRFLDNLEDGTQKQNGKFKGMSKLRRKDEPKEDRKTVVVLGTGWASHAFVKLASTYDLRIVVVSPVNHFVFTPMLASAAVGTVEYRSMTEPIRVTNPCIDNFVEGRAIGVNVNEKKVQVQLSSLSTVTNAFKGVASSAPCRLEPQPVLTQILYDDDTGMPLRDKAQGAGGVIELSYDHLICAVGTASNSNIVRGAKEYCFNLKTSQDSKRLRTAIGEALEMASRPDLQEYYYNDEETKIMAREERQRAVRIAVVGGGPTGVELSGELCDFFKQICSTSLDGPYQHLRDDVSVMLIHGGNELLPSMDVDLRERALQSLQAQGVEVRLNTRLREVGQDYIRVGEKGSDVEETIPLGITVWAAGNAPVPFVKELLSQLPESSIGGGGRIKVDQWMRADTGNADSFGSVFVLGDVACYEEQFKYDEAPSTLPQTAQVAGQQGAFVARMLNRGYDMQQTPPKLPELSADEAFSLLRVWLVSRGLEEAPGFTFLSLGLLAYIGQEEALNQVMVGNVPLFNYSGKIAFVLWRSVYLAKQASSRNQALIAFDWLRTKEFGRDITRL